MSISPKPHKYFPSFLQRGNSSWLSACNDDADVLSDNRYYSEGTAFGYQPIMMQHMSCQMNFEEMIQCPTSKYPMSIILLMYVFHTNVFRPINMGLSYWPWKPWHIQLLHQIYLTLTAKCVCKYFWWKMYYQSKLGCLEDKTWSWTCRWCWQYHTNLYAKTRVKRYTSIRLPMPQQCHTNLLCQYIPLP